MALPCSICGAMPHYPQKTATLYWRWPASPDDWARYKQRACAACVRQAVLPILQFAGVHEDECCHGADHHEGEMVYTYFTLYTPKVKDKPTADGRVSTCLEHLPQVRGAMTRGAESLGSGTGRPVPDPRESEWDGVDLPWSE